MFKFLETNRLIIRKFEENDLDEVFDYASNQEVMRYLPEDVFIVILEILLHIRLWRK